MPTSTTPSLAADQVPLSPSPLPPHLLPLHKPPPLLLLLMRSLPLLRPPHKPQVPLHPPPLAPLSAHPAQMQPSHNLLHSLRPAVISTKQVPHFLMGQQVNNLAQHMQQAINLAQQVQKGACRVGLQALKHQAALQNLSPAGPPLAASLGPPLWALHQQRLLARQQAVPRVLRTASPPLAAGTRSDRSRLTSLPPFSMWPRCI
mmetsp:Transcript_17775/g.49633  ORF Transcript_17775/g.49633 Transcript_17775/m.49633 type:complete len:203 (+) Transcript_17775:1129-1737(+)